MFVSFSSHSWQWYSKVSFNWDSLRIQKRAHKTETLAVSAFNFMTNRLSCWHNFQSIINRFFAVFLASNQAILNELTIRNFCGRWQNAIQIKCIRFLKLCKFEMRVCLCVSVRVRTMWYYADCIIDVQWNHVDKQPSLGFTSFLPESLWWIYCIKEFHFCLQTPPIFFTYLFT